MGNRHHHKKMRADARAAMTATGESYQQALCRLQSARRGARAVKPDVDLISIAYFGTPATLATFEILGELACLALSGGRFSAPFPGNPFFALARRRGLA